MVRLQILTGKQNGAVFEGARFPIQAGRSKDCDLVLDDLGVWPRHFRIDWQAEGLILEAESDALLNVNDTPVRRAVLRNGDVMTVGAARIRFSFSPVRASSQATVEWLTWIALAALCLGQVGIIYKLL